MAVAGHAAVTMLAVHGSASSSVLKAAACLTAAVAASSGSTCMMCNSDCSSYAFRLFLSCA